MSESPPCEETDVSSTSDGIDFSEKQYPWRDAELLETLYWDEWLSTRDIAEKFDCNNTTILDWLERHGIEKRGKGCAREYPELQDERFLRTHYVEQEKTANEIADELGCGVSDVTGWLRKHGIAVTNGHIQELRDKDLLRELYVEQELSMAAIGEKLDCDPRAVNKWLNRHGIETRKPGYGSHSGENNPNWRGGSRQTKNYGETWPEQREKALERDGYECRGCGLSNEEHLEKYSRSLSVHHVVPVDEYDDVADAHTLENLVSACKSCHRRFEGLPVFPR